MNRKTIGFEKKTHQFGVNSLLNFIGILDYVKIFVKKIFVFFFVKIDIFIK